MLCCEFPDTHHSLQNWVSESRFLYRSSSGLHSIWIYPAREPLSSVSSPQMLKWARAVTALGLWASRAGILEGADLRSTSGILIQAPSKSSCVIKLTPMPQTFLILCECRYPSGSAGPLTQRGGDELQREGEGAYLAGASTSVLKAATVSSRQRRAAENSCCSERIQASAWELLASGLALAPPVAWPAFIEITHREGGVSGRDWPRAVSGAASSLLSAEAEC